MMTGTILNRMMIMTMMNRSEERPPVNTDNDGAIFPGENLPNHSLSLAGRGKFVGVGLSRVPQFRTKQELYRFVAWCIVMEEAQNLPDEEGAHTLDEVLDAVRLVK